MAKIEESRKGHHAWDSYYEWFQSIYVVLRRAPVELLVGKTGIIQREIECAEGLGVYKRLGDGTEFKECL